MDGMSGFAPGVAFELDNCTVTVAICWESDHEPIGYFYLQMPIALMGVVTNTLNLIVLHHKTFKTKVTACTLLVAMAIADLVACSVIFPIGIIISFFYIYTVKLRSFTSD